MMECKRPARAKALLAPSFLCFCPYMATILIRLIPSVLPCAIDSLVFPAALETLLALLQTLQDALKDCCPFSPFQPVKTMKKLYKSDKNPSLLHFGFP